ncbi:hypothetical protein BD324DRAFT_680167 [Kockovaella imperatae]|uniref:Uncharacterized protein n=1 Tax=Kockovaella imperatae TaxID=4999 RepID=A0A1Y1UK50_9TREE|nr:hypothetical protein BD324DRAFT_680167 [Kockovaella imperatae]ORX38431.1 hypothetical protein BD324DRAFT_680167 [Kockovaella imperatae]
MSDAQVQAPPPGATSAATQEDNAEYKPEENGDAPEATDVAVGEKRKAEDEVEKEDDDKKAKVDEEVAADKGKGKGKSEPAPAEPEQEGGAEEGNDDDDEDPDNLIISGKRRRNKVNYADVRGPWRRRWTIMLTCHLSKPLSLKLRRRLDSNLVRGRRMTMMMRENSRLLKMMMRVSSLHAPTPSRGEGLLLLTDPAQKRVEITKRTGRMMRTRRKTMRMRKTTNRIMIW